MTSRSFLFCQFSFFFFCVLYFFSFSLIFFIGGVFLVLFSRGLLFRRTFCSFSIYFLWRRGKRIVSSSFLKKLYSKSIFSFSFLSYSRQKRGEKKKHSLFFLLFLHNREVAKWSRHGTLTPTFNSSNLFFPATCRYGGTGRR